MSKRASKKATRGLDDDKVLGPAALKKGSKSSPLVDDDDFAPRSKPKVNVFALLNGMGDDMDVDGDEDEGSEKEEDIPVPVESNKPSKPKVESDDEDEKPKKKSKSKSKNSYGSDSGEDKSKTPAKPTANGKARSKEEDEEDDRGKRGNKKVGKSSKSEEPVDDEAIGKGKKKRGKKGHVDEDAEVQEQPKKSAKQLLAEEEAALAAEAAKKSGGQNKKQGKGGKGLNVEPEASAASPASDAVPQEGDGSSGKKKKVRSGGPQTNGLEDEAEGGSPGISRSVITSRGKKIKGKWIPVKVQEENGEDEEEKDSENDSDDENNVEEQRLPDEDEEQSWRKEDHRAKDRKLKEKLLSRSPGSTSPRSGPSGFQLLEQSRRRGASLDDEEEEAAEVESKRRNGKKVRAPPEVVEEEEPEVVEKPKKSGKTSKTARFADAVDEEVAAVFADPPKKKKSKSRGTSEDAPAEIDAGELGEERSHKKKSKKAAKDAEEPAAVEDVEAAEEVETVRRKKKKSKQVDETPLDDTSVNEATADVEEPRPKKKKSKKPVEDSEAPLDEEASEEMSKPRKRKESSKRHRDPSEEEVVEIELPEPAEKTLDDMDIDESSKSGATAGEDTSTVPDTTKPKKSGKGKASWRQKAVDKPEKGEKSGGGTLEELLGKVSNLTISDAKAPEAAPPKKDANPKKTAVSGADLGMGLDGDEMASQARVTKTVAVFEAASRRTVGRGVVSEQQADGTFQSSTTHITATGSLVSDDTSKDIIIDNFSLAAWGTNLIKDGTLKLAHGRRYGLLGVNGAGKSTLLKTLGNREVPIQNAIDIYLLDREFDPTDMTAVEAVVDIVVREKEALEQELEELLDQDGGSETPRFEAINDRINELDVGTAERRAKEVLHGLGFSPEMQQMKTREFSGGWRMRIALARALFVKPTLLLLDEPTNHLDLGACVWLEEYLKKYSHTVLLVSHSQDFLNGVCTDIMHLHNRKLDYYNGDYDTFVVVRAQKDATLTKKAKAAEKQLSKMQDTVARLGQKVAKQAKQKEKAMVKKTEKLEDVKDELVQEKAVSFRFNDCGGGLAPPVLQFRDISFNYPGKSRVLFKDVTFGVDLESRIALVGPNGAGKSTLLKLMVGEVQPTSGEIRKHHHLRIARFHQHLTDQLDLSLSAVQYLCASFKDEDGNALYKEQAMRNIVGKYGLTGKSQVVPMSQISDGQRRRVVFAWLALTTPHMLLLDEPTNHLDIETIDALAEAINAFDGGVILVSHDFRLIEQVAQEIWIVQDEKVEPWEDDIRAYKEHLRSIVIKDEEEGVV